LTCIPREQYRQWLADDLEHGSTTVDEGSESTSIGQFSPAPTPSLPPPPPSLFSLPFVSLLRMMAPIFARSTPLPIPTVQQHQHHQKQGSAHDDGSSKEMNERQCWNDDGNGSDGNVAVHPGTTIQRHSHSLSDARAMITLTAQQLLDVRAHLYRKAMQTAMMNTGGGSDMASQSTCIDGNHSSPSPSHVSHSTFYHAAPKAPSSDSVSECAPNGVWLLRFDFKAENSSRSSASSTLTSSSSLYLRFYCRSDLDMWLEFVQRLWEVKWRRKMRKRRMAQEEKTAMENLKANEPQM